MSTFHGTQGKGAMRAHRVTKRLEAEARAMRSLLVRNLTRLANEAQQRSQAEPDNTDGGAS